MKGVIGKLAWAFCLLLLISAFFCWKLADLRTPQVLCVNAKSGVVDGSGYAVVLPLECVQWTDSGAYVYAVEETSSYFSPLVVRQIPVTVQAQDSVNAAVSGIYGKFQIVRFSSRPLSGDMTPVQLWKGAGA